MDEEQILTLRSALAEAGPRVDAARAEDERSNVALEAAEARLNEWQASWESFNERAAANQRESDVEASRIEHFEQVLQRLRTRAAQLDDEARNIVAGDTSDDIGELAAGIAAETASLKAAELDMEHCLAELGASREDLVIREQVLEEARSDVQVLRHELASLEAVQRAALGRTEGAADDWLRTQKLDRCTARRRQVVGRLRLGARGRNACWAIACRRFMSTRSPPTRNSSRAWNTVWSRWSTAGASRRAVAICRRFRAS